MPLNSYRNFKVRERGRRSCDVRVTIRWRMYTVKHNRHFRFFVVLGLNFLIIQFIALIRLYWFLINILIESCPCHILYHAYIEDQIIGNYYFIDNKRAKSVSLECLTRIFNELCQ